MATAICNSAFQLRPSSLLSFFLLFIHTMCVIRVPLHKSTTASPVTVTVLVKIPPYRSPGCSHLPSSSQTMTVGTHEPTPSLGTARITGNRSYTALWWMCLHVYVQALIFTLQDFLLFLGLWNVPVQRICCNYPMSVFFFFLASISEAQLLGRQR